MEYVNDVTHFTLYITITARETTTLHINFHTNN